MKIFVNRDVRYFLTVVYAGTQKPVRTLWLYIINERGALVNDEPSM